MRGQLTVENAKMVDDCEPVQGISVNPGSIHPTKVTEIESDAVMCAEAIAKPQYSLISASDISDIKTYLARPRAYNAGLITTGTGFLNVTNFNTRIDFTNVFGTTAFDRMVGCVGFRATMVFRVVVTATPFHQGILALNWQYATSTFGNSARRGHFPYLCTNLPHVKLDVSEATQAVLRVPFVSHREYIPISTEVWSGIPDAHYGTVALTKITDFRVGGTQLNARYTLYASLEDVELLGAMPYGTSSVTLQAGMSVEDKEALKGGIVSGTLGALAGVATQVSRFPSLRVLGTSTAWFLRCASKAASAFGFSRPMDTRGVKKHYIPGYRFESHLDVPNTGITVSPFQENKLLVDGTVGLTDIDHMSFDHILSIPAMIFRGTTGATASAGDFIYGAHVSPSCFWYREGGTTNGNITMPANASGVAVNCFAPSHLLYIGNGFRYWRGDLKFTFVFSKTKMHGGRVVVSFIPNPTVLDGNSVLSNSLAVPANIGSLVSLEGYNKMFDLRDSSTFDFVVPYTSLDPYTQVLGKIGDISMQIVTPINSPTNAADSIDFLVFVEALPGFQFAGVCPSTLESMGPGSTQVSGGVQLQAGGVESVSDQSEHVIGEKFMSTKQIMMLPARHTQVIGTTVTNPSYSFTLKPYFCRERLPSLNGTTAPTATTQCPFYSAPTRMIDMFAFANGSTDYTFVKTNGTNNIDISINNYGTDGNKAFTGSGSGNLYNKNNNASAGHTILESSNVMRFRVPAYSRFARVPIQPITQFYSSSQNANLVASASDSQYLAHGYNFYAYNYGNIDRNIYVSVSAGEDAYCSHYVGPPLCILFQASSVSRPNTNPNVNVIPWVA